MDNADQRIADDNASFTQQSLAFLLLFVGGVFQLVAFSSVLWSISSYLVLYLVLGYGGWLVLRGKLTPGDVVMFVAHLDKLYGPVDSLNEIAVGMQNHTTSRQRAVALLHTEGAEVPGEPIPAGNSAVEFRDVHFGYVAGRDVLRGLNLKTQPGKITVLAGPSGAGKTTTADLLLKLYAVGSGELFWDGHAISRAGGLRCVRLLELCRRTVRFPGELWRTIFGTSVRRRRMMRCWKRGLRRVWSVLWLGCRMGFRQRSGNAGWGYRRGRGSGCRLPGYWWIVRVCWCWMRPRRTWTMRRRWS